MTVYRKLAASSIVALEKALLRRLARLQSTGLVEAARQAGLDDERDVGESEAMFDTSHEDFFAVAIQRRKTLEDEFAVHAEGDDKMAALLHQVERTSDGQGRRVTGR